MKYGVHLCNFTPFDSVEILTEMAVMAEEAGWDGFFIWDEIAGWPGDLVEPTIALAAIAQATKKIRFGTLITPLPRRRPWKVARETATLDRFSKGRLILGVGSGTGKEAWDDLDEQSIPRERGAMLDEALEVLTGLWTAKPFSHSGKYYTVKDANFLPGPVQQPRIPIWVAGVYPARKPLARMAKWDGMFPLTSNYKDHQEELSQLAEMVRSVRELRGDNPAPFDVVLMGNTPAGNKDQAREIAAGYAAAGATWFMEALEPTRNFTLKSDFWTLEQLKERVLAGPPRIE